MKNEWERAEGIIIKMTPFKEYDQILTLFTCDQGLLKLFIKGPKKGGKISRYTPLMRVEAIFKETKSELCPCDNLTVIHSYLALRNHLIHLESACDLLTALSASQLVGKEAPPLYHLLIYYLDKIPLALDPWTLAASFRLKILRYEGILNQTYFPDDPYFSVDDWSLIEYLGFCHRYSQLAELQLPDGFMPKLYAFFNCQIQQ